MNYIVFEDHSYKNLLPFTINHTSCELRCGAFTNIQRIQNLVTENDKIYIIVREELCDITRERFPEFVINPDIIPAGIHLNGATLWDSQTLSKIENSKHYSHNGNLISMYVDHEIKLEIYSNYVKRAIQVTVDIPAIHFLYLWDCIFTSEKVLIRDVDNFSNYKGLNVHESVIYDTFENIFIDKSSKVCLGVILDASQGPIIIDENVKIDIGALIQGPAYIGKDSVINPGAKLRGNVILGPRCKIGGEVEDVIIQGYSNKQHDGFLGHSYIGEWVNLGANTNNSDLKNNYSTIRVNLTKDLEINTLHQFLGVLIGDYTKSGISTMFNTGTVVGIGANVFGSGFQKKYIESFSWGNGDTKTDFKKFIETSTKVKERRNCILSDKEIKFLKSFYSKIE